MQDEEGFDDNPKVELVDFNYKPLVIHSQLKRKPISKPLSLQGWQFARDVNSGEATRAIIQKQPQNIVYSSYLRETVIQDVQLQFQAEFQSSNLELVVRRRFLEFQIYIKADTNTNAYQQWFYFKVKCCKGPKTASFTIKNLAKSGMLYESGLKPYFRRGNSGNYSQLPGSVKYYQNVPEDSFCLKFSFQFLTQGEQVQFCSQPPYTYTKLLDFLSQRKIQWKSLCKSQLGKKVPYLTLHQQKSPKGYAIVFARQHPGESVGSWMMEGLIQKLKNSTSQGIQWLVIPMFNVDGVIVGNNRTGLSGFDYNRYWNAQELNKKQKHFPEILAFINLMKFLKRLHPKKPKIVFDLHGHSSQPNIFSYGPPNEISSEYFYVSRAFPQLLSRKNKNFNIEQCSYVIRPDKKNTARSFMFHQLLIPFVYTIQASFGIMRDKSVNQHEFLEFGKDLVDATHQFMCSCVIGQKPVQANVLIEAVKARGEIQEVEEFDSDSQRQQFTVNKKAPSTERNIKHGIRMATEVCHITSHKQQENSFQLFKVQQNPHNRYQKTVEKRRNHTQVGLNNIKKNHFLPKLKESCCVKNRASSSLKQEQMNGVDSSLMNIKQIQKRLFRLRNSRIGKKILIINAYGI